MNSLIKKMVIAVSGLLVAFLIIFFFFILPSLREETLQPSTQINPTLIPPPTTSYPTIIKNVQDQGQADENFGTAMKNSRAPYPWYNSTPLQTNDYFVYFDIPQKKFFGKIYSTSNHLSEEQIASVKTEAQTKLQNLGINLNQYPIEWRLGL